MSYQSELIDELRERAQVAESLLAKLTAEIDAKGGAVSARDLLGMWDVARRRADTAEASLAQACAAVAAQEDRDAAACGRIGLFPDGPNTADMLADEVIELRLQVSAMEAKVDKAEADAKTLRGAIAAQDARDLAACVRVGIPPQGCDTSDELADELLGFKAELAELLPLWPQRDHGSRCKAPYDQRAECTCPAYEANTAREKALKLVGVPNGR